MTNFNPVEHRIFEGLSGSHLYGMSTPESDVDTRGVCLPPFRVMTDPFMKFDVQDSFADEDRAIYSLSKFFNLAADANPNIVELLFVPEMMSQLWTKTWQKVVDNRHLFLSKNVKHRFLGYAFSQLEAIKRHREWFINPPERKPVREDFGLPEMPSVSMAWLKELKTTLNFELLKPEYVEEVRKEKAYEEEKKKWDNYNQWSKNRNPKRKGTEEKFGYDSKYASHLFRLMTEGKQLLLEGVIKFPLYNAEYLLAIKNGALAYEEMLELAGSMAGNFDNWYDLSTLPDKPDRNGLKELYFEILGV
jgi:predicted nucleotidyltransferase